MFLLVLDETWFLRRTLGSIHRNLGQVPFIRGYPKGGGCPPLDRRGGGVHRGGIPSKGSLPYAVFGLLFVRTKSNPGFGGGAPDSIEKKMEYSRRLENKNKLFCSSRSSRGKICG